MFHSWFRAFSAQKYCHALCLLSRNASTPSSIPNQISRLSKNGNGVFLNATKHVAPFSAVKWGSICTPISRVCQAAANLCTIPEHEVQNDLLGPVVLSPSEDPNKEMKEIQEIADHSDYDEPKEKPISWKTIDFTKIPIEKLPTVLIIGRPNALVYNTPNDHVTRDIRDGVAKLGDLRFRVLDSAGLEAEASSGSVLGRTAAMTEDVLSRAHFILFLIDARCGIIRETKMIADYLHIPYLGSKVAGDGGRILSSLVVGFQRASWGMSRCSPQMLSHKSKIKPLEAAYGRKLR
ncbi:GTPase Der [Striga asiatica]|uniref:GTPase Der n=1 Tax=Striga asiatica TaxID=4170 RepID=A0A5A7R5P7_STRAF|nr:GTPase Der [Striga asiatica]